MVRQKLCKVCNTDDWALLSYAAAIKSAAFPDPAKTKIGVFALTASRAASSVAYPPSMTTTTVGTSRSPEHNTLHIISHSVYARQGN